MTGPAVVVDQLVKRYGSIVALDGLSLEVQRGEIFGLLGPNGAGKTTTVETLEGFRAPSSGSVRVLGLDPRADARRLTPHIGVMLQEGGTYPGIRPLEALRLFTSYYPTPDDPERLLDLVGLRPVARTEVRRLSGGEKQRLSLALALAGRPTIAFLDEPTAGMDPRAKATTWDVVRSLRAEGATVVLTTHAMDEAETLCDRVAIIDRGRLVACGAPSELTSAAGVAADTRFRARPGLDTGAIAGALGLVPAAVFEREPGEYVIAAEATPERVAALTLWLRDAGEALGDLQAGRRSLEEVFLRLTDPGNLDEEHGGGAGR